MNIDDKKKLFLDLETLEKHRVEILKKNNDIKIGVAALITNYKREVLLLLRKLNPQANYWTIPGGKVNKNESFKMAIEREVKEETGLGIGVLKFLTITKPEDIDISWFSPVFLANIKTGELENLEPNKHAKVCWCSLLKLPTRLNITTMIAIKEYRIIIQDLTY